MKGYCDSYKEAYYLPLKACFGRCLVTLESKTSLALGVRKCHTFLRSVAQDYETLYITVQSMADSRDVAFNELWLWKLPYLETFTFCCRPV